VGAAIYLAPLGVSNKQLVSALQERLSKQLGKEVLLETPTIDLEAVRSAERNQYYSTKLIAQALTFYEGREGKFILLVDVDLYIPVFTFVFGEAMLNGSVSIVSLCRLYEEFYSSRTDDALLMRRAMKELLHELGHNYGLYHCSDWNCVMHASTGIEEVDIKGDFYCKSCAAVVRNG
jgi:archaemetzincin